MEPSVSIRNYTKEELLEAFCRDVDAFALELASGDNSGDLLTTVEETIEEVIDTSTKVLGMVVSIFLTLLILVCLTACLCYCCHQVRSTHCHSVQLDGDNDHDGYLDHDGESPLETTIMIVFSSGLQRQDQECVRADQLRGGARQQGGRWNEQGC